MRLFAGQLDQLRSKVKAFEDASGLDISRSWGVEVLGSQVAIVQRLQLDPAFVATRIDRSAEAALKDCEAAIEQIRTAQRKANEVAAAIRALAAPCVEAVPTHENINVN